MPQKIAVFGAGSQTIGVRRKAGHHSRRTDKREVLGEMAHSEPIPCIDLAEYAAKLHREKYDSFLPDELLKAALAVERPDAESMPMVAQQIVDR
jgi:hypothetical protein